LNKYYRFSILTKDFLNMCEPELTAASQFSAAPLQTSSFPSNVPSVLTIIDAMVVPPPSPPLSSAQSLPSSTSLPSVFTFPPSLRWLLPPSYDASSVVWTTNNNTHANTSQLTDLSSPSSQTKSEIETIANQLFQDIKQEKEEMYNDRDFLDILEEWYKETEENVISNERNLQYW
jgi:hypothetical protein